MKANSNSSCKKNIYSINRKFLEHTLDSIPDGITIIKPDYTIVYGNKATCDWYNKSLEEIKGLKCYEIMGRKKACDNCYVPMALNQRKIISNVKYFSELDRYMHCVYSPIIDKNNSIEYVIERMVDITNMKNYEKKLVDIQAQHNTLLNHLPFAAWLKDSDRRYIAVNNAFTKFFKVDKNKIIGKRSDEVFGEDTAWQYGEDDIEVLKAKKEIQFEKKIVMGSYEMFIEVNKSPIISLDKNILGIAGTIRDITEQKKNQEKLLKAKKKVEAANELKNNILKNVSHEMRTPLNGIVGTLNLLKSTKLTDEQKEYINILEESSERLSSMIYDLLDLSKMEFKSIELENIEFELKLLLDKIIKYVGLKVQKKNLKFIYKIDPYIPQKVIGDPNKLQQILFKFLDNAIKFTNDGYISFEVLNLETNKNASKIKFVIKDTGIGMPNNKIDSLFQNFTQLDNFSRKKYSGIGTGLGLARKLIEIMGGKIEVKSQVNRGSDFSFQLDFNRADEKMELIDEKKINILLAEDDLTNQKIIKRMLEKKGWNVSIASNGMKVLEKIYNNNFNIILMDINMPEMDGYEATKIIRKNKINIPIIAITAATMREDQSRCLKVGMNDYISKPIRAENLYQIINNYAFREEEDVMKINFGSILEGLDNNMELLEILINDFTSEEYKKNVIDKISESINLKDSKMLEKHAHKLKGTLSYFKIPYIYDLAYNLEKKGKENDFNNANYLFDNLLEQYQSLVNILLSYPK